jgi:archaellum component FlaC
MITSKIAANQAFSHVNRIHKGDDAARQANGQDDVIKTPKGEAVDGIKADISAFSANPLHKLNAEFNAVVKSIRIADKAMGEIETNVEQMQSEVEMFLKQYPPYPPGSEDRIKYLSRFAMLRKQIDQLTFPPDAGAKYILGQSGNPRSADWEIEFDSRKTGATIRQQPVHTGREGLALPEISVASTDEEVQRMQAALGEARLEIQQRRGELAKDASRVIRSAEKLING